MTGCLHNRRRTCHGLLAVGSPGWGRGPGLAVASGGRLLTRLAHHGDRAGGVVQHPVTDRTQQQRAGDTAPPVAHHQQVRTLGRQAQGTGGVAHQRLGVHLHVRVLVAERGDLLGDHPLGGPGGVQHVLPAPPPAGPYQFGSDITRTPLVSRSAKREPVALLLPGEVKVNLGLPFDLDAEQDSSQVCVALPMERGTFRISSAYGYRTHPILGGRAMHAGTDFAAPMGTPIYAVTDGTAVYRGAGQQGRSSELLILSHEVDGQRFYSWHVHSYPSGIHVSVGDEVVAGQHIADVGDNGMATGPHLHFEIHTASPSFAPSAGQAAGGVARFGLTGTLALMSSLDEQDTEPLPDPSPSSTTPAPDPEPEPEPSSPPQPEPDPEPEPEPAPEPEEPVEGEPEPSSPEPTPEPEPEPEPSPEPEPEPSPSLSPEPEPDRTERQEPGPGEPSRPTTPLPPGAVGTTVDPVPFLQNLGYGVVNPSQC